ncbi:MAG: ABC transporter ATP-binding protein [FCB group bacterium]|nr:ABC transporter ATP-binding protein [FCB group bacterium]
MNNFVSITNLSKAYKTIKAVVDFSLEVNKGEIYALLGPDGAGKTTIMRTLCHLLTPDEGTISIDGFNVEKEFDRIKPLLGYMPQVFSLYPDLTVEENLNFYSGIYGVTRREYEKKTEAFYRFSQLKPFAKRRAADLSGGMKQKLALSCALMHDPQLLLLDEPTTGVDPLSRRQFWEILLELKEKGVTIIVSTPYMDEAARTDRVCFIYNGKKMVEDTPENLPQLFEGQVFLLNMYPTSAMIEKINNIKNIQARRFGAGMHLYLDKNDHIENHTQELQKAEINIDLLKPISPSLEDCFVQFMEKTL